MVTGYRQSGLRRVAEGGCLQDQVIGNKAGDCKGRGFLPRGCESLQNGKQFLEK